MKQTDRLRRATPVLVAVALVMTLMVPASAFLFGGETQPASVATFSKNGTIQEVIAFSPDDFTVQGGGKTQLDSIVLTSLPSSEAGLLKLGDAELAAGDQVAMSAISGLRFYPLSSPTVASTQFSFTPVFSDGSSGEEAQVSLHLLSAPNSAPVAENLELCTYKNVAITGYFSATDPEGDLITFQLVEKPARGAVTLSEDGSAEFVYTPYENKTGKDTFSYVAVDAVGNTSAPATVKIKIQKANTKVTYADMDGVPAYRDAIRLAEEGVLIGECMGGSYFFRPDQPVSRSEFVALAMNTVGLDSLEGMTRTGFADDNSIPTWAKPYVSSALKAGVIQGSANEQGQVVFNSGATVTRAEASVLLDRLLQISDVSAETWYADSELAPAWAYQSAVNLETAGILRTNAQGALALEDTLTRADAAQMLSAALDVIDARNATGWFHW